MNTSDGHSLSTPSADSSTTITPPSVSSDDDNVNAPIHYKIFHLHLQLFQTNQSTRKTLCLLDADPSKAYICAPSTKRSANELIHTPHVLVSSGQYNKIANVPWNRNEKSTYVVSLYFIFSYCIHNISLCSHIFLTILPFKTRISDVLRLTHRRVYGNPTSTSQNASLSE